MKKIKSTFIFIMTLILLTGNMYAVDLDNPYPTDFLVPLRRIFNLFLMFAGIVLAIMIVYGAIKLSMALGDPRKLQGARQTLTYAVFGFGIIMFFFAGVYFILRALGVDVTFADPNQIFDQIEAGIVQFLEDAKVYKQP